MSGTNKILKTGDFCFATRAAIIVSGSWRNSRLCNFEVSAKKKKVKYLQLPASFMQVFAALLSILKVKEKSFRLFVTQKALLWHTGLKSFHFCPTGGRNFLRKLW